MGDKAAAYLDKIMRILRKETTGHSVSWIDSLLETPIEDHRKYVMWRILAPYLINVRELSKDEAFNVVRDWLNKCHQLRKLDFNPEDKI